MSTSLKSLEFFSKVASCLKLNHEGIFSWLNLVEIKKQKILEMEIMIKGKTHKGEFLWGVGLEVESKHTKWLFDLHWGRDLAHLSL